MKTDCCVIHCNCACAARDMGLGVADVQTLRTHTRNVESPSNDAVMKKMFVNTVTPQHKHALIRAEIASSSPKRGASVDMRVFIIKGPHYIR